MSTTHPACTDPRCTTCVEEQLYAGVFSPREEEEARIDEGLARAARQIADTPLVTDRDIALLLEESDQAIAEAQANGTDYYEVLVRGSSVEERVAHNHDVAGSSPAPATTSKEN